jgi:hypothetical protein
MKALSWTLVAGMAFLSAAAPMFGDVIVSEAYSSGTSGSVNGFLAFSWTQPGTFDNVTIAAPLTSSGVFVSTGTAYLSNKLGSGATSTNLLDTFDISTNNNDPSVLITLFTGLTLGPGTYFLSIQESSTLFSIEAGTPVQTKASGVTQGADMIASGAVGTPAISTSFSDTTGTTQMLFDVTGTPVAGVTGTPEPSMIAMLVVGLGGIVFARRLRNRNQAI